MTVHRVSFLDETDKHLPHAAFIETADVRSPSQRTRQRPLRREMVLMQRSQPAVLHQRLPPFGDA
jgi:hypothetical protein